MYTNAKIRIRQAGICLLKANNKNFRTRCAICMGVCVPRPSALGPFSRPSVLKILQEQSYEQSILLIQDYTYSRLKHTYSRYSNSYLERPSYGVQNKWEGLSSQSFFFSLITKETEKNVPIYEPQTCSIRSESSSP